MKRSQNSPEKIFESIFHGNKKYSHTDAFSFFSEHKDATTVEWVDQFFSDCLFPLELYYDQWLANLKELRELLELEKAMLIATENNSEANAYRQRLNVYSAALCFYENDVERFKTYGNLMFQDSKSNILAYNRNDRANIALRQLLPRWSNPLIYFSSQCLFGSPCITVF